MRSRGGGLPVMVFLLACTVTAGAAAVVAVERLSVRLSEKTEPTHEPAAAHLAGLRLGGPESIAAEADVFRLSPGMLGIDPTARREKEAHPRTLRSFHYLRAYPGAPPRIPHGLTPDEFRTGACKTCHEKGGYSQRFAAYVPVTPHPEMGFCLQCHVGDDAVTGISHPSADPNDRCRQCHGPDGPPRPGFDASLNWVTTAWPKPEPVTPGRNPPTIPHDLDTRGNCLACHAGPAAVAEIRTSHPGWADCRQCHLARGEDSGEYTRPSAAAPGGTP